MEDFLLELGFEELPARFIPEASRQLAQGVTAKLKKERLNHGEVLTYNTPRRLALILKNLSARQGDKIVEVKGPPKNIAYDQRGELTKAGRGFLRSQKVAEEAVEIRELGGGDYLFVRKKITGQATQILLKPLLEEVITALTFPKNMRWGIYELRYARPLRWIMALFGAEVIPVQIGPVQGGTVTYGHRQLSSGPLRIKHPREYVSTLREHYVLVEASQRRHAIWDQIEGLALKQGARVRKDEELLSEITNLVEYPTAFCGAFAAEYLQVPPEVLITVMKTHQRYFPLVDQEGQLLPKFIGVRNGADNHLENVIRGNEKVLAARLADARFFFQEDCQTPLENNLEQLKGVVFQEGLGSLREKVERITRLSALLAQKLNLAEEKESILRTARLAKADLVSQMVYEFPELQGVMGEKYALLQGESPAVALGIKEHYQPRFSGDVVPRTTEGTIVSLADKMDSLAGYFALGRLPTGSQDPFGLRRLASGVVQILIQRDFSLSLQDLIVWAAQAYSEVVLDAKKTEQLKQFFLARLRLFLQNKGYPYDVIDAVLAAPDDRLPRQVAKIQVLNQFRETTDFKDLVTAFERMSNLVAKAAAGGLEPSLFQPADQQFLKALDALKENCQHELAVGRYDRVLLHLARFKSPTDQFFEAALIMDENPIIRQNRLTLLQSALEVYHLYGDFQLIVVNK